MNQYTSITGTEVDKTTRRGWTHIEPVYQYNWYGGGQNNKKRLDPHWTSIPVQLVRRRTKQQEEAGPTANQYTSITGTEVDKTTRIGWTHSEPVYQYNWYGGGQNNKKRLDPQRTEIIRGYILLFYPEVRDSDVFNEQL